MKLFTGVMLKLFMLKTTGCYSNKLTSQLTN